MPIHLLAAMWLLFSIIRTIAQTFKHIKDEQTEDERMKVFIKAFIESPYWPIILALCVIRDIFWQDTGFID